MHKIIWVLVSFLFIHSVHANSRKGQFRQKLQEWKNLSPEERKARLQNRMQKFRKNNPEAAKKFQEWQSLSQEERQSKMQSRRKNLEARRNEFFKKNPEAKEYFAKNKEAWQKMTPEQKKAKLAQLQAKGREFASLNPEKKIAFLKKNFPDAFKKMQARQKEWDSLSVEQRDARVQEFLNKNPQLNSKLKAGWQSHLERLKSQDPEKFSNYQRAKKNWETLSKDQQNKIRENYRSSPEFQKKRELWKKRAMEQWNQKHKERMSQNE